MRRISIIVSVIALIIALLLAFLRFGTLPLFPAAVGLVGAYLALRLSKQPVQKKFPKVLILLAALTALVVGFQRVFLKNKIAEDASFEQLQEDSQKKALEELEELDEELDISTDSIPKP